MEFFQHRYYRLGKVLLSLMGQWPAQSIYIRRAILTFICLFTAYASLSQVFTVLTYWGDVNMILENLVPSTCSVIYATKYLGFMFNQQKGVQTVKLLNRIRTDWQVWAQDRDVKILHEYAQSGEKITIVYAAALYVSMFIAMTQPIIWKLIHDVLKNDTAPGRFLFPIIHCYIDEQKYFFYLVAYWLICSYMVLTFLVASDVMLILYVQHVCGIFAALGHKLERIGSKDKPVDTEGFLYEFSKTQMMELSSCIVRHNDAIEFAELIKASYAWNVFITMGLGMAVCNVAGLQILLKASDLRAALVFILVFLAAICYFYIECYISQILTDHSIRIRIHVNNSQWYRLPPNAQKCLQLITIRCYIPCHLTAGNICTISVETFGTAVKTLMSYLACFRSMRAV